jgi:hypothetical protein
MKEATLMVNCQWLLHGAALVLSVFALLGTALAEPAAAQGVPSGGIVDVTGYSQVTLYGSFGPLTVAVKGKKAAAIRSALAGLSATSSLPDCMETHDAFTISFRTRQSRRPTYVATEDDCPTPGVVSISIVGKTTQHLNLKEDCTLRAAVIAALPGGRAEGTRRDESRCSL